MPRKTTASLLALVLTIALALPVAAAPQGMSAASWLAGMVAEIVDAMEASLSSVLAAQAVDQAPKDVVEQAAAEQDNQEEEPVPNFWPGYDPVG